MFSEKNTVTQSLRTLLLKKYEFKMQQQDVPEGSQRRSQRTHRPTRRYGYNSEGRRSAATSSFRVDPPAGPVAGSGEEDDEVVPGGLQSQDEPPPGDVSAPPGHISTWQEEGLPSWEVVHVTIIPTMKHIPKPARQDLAKVLETSAPTPPHPRGGFYCTFCLALCSGQDRASFSYLTLYCLIVNKSSGPKRRTHHIFYWVQKIAVVQRKKRVVFSRHFCSNFTSTSLIRLQPTQAFMRLS